MSDDPQTYQVAPWKFVVAVVVMLILMTLGTFFWMWRDSQPRRRPTMPVVHEPAIVVTNSTPSTP